MLHYKTNNNQLKHTQRKLGFWEGTYLEKYHSAILTFPYDYELQRYFQGAKIFGPLYSIDDLILNAIFASVAHNQTNHDCHLIMDTQESSRIALN